MTSYPKWLYHPTEPARIVPDEATHKALGESWVESPADVVKPEPKPEAAPVEKPHKKGR